MKRTALSPETYLQWAELAHASFLNALMRASRWKPGELAFHGGTSLHLCWQSSRYSEDLDFLLSSACTEMKKTLQRAVNDVEQAFRAYDPMFEIEVRDKTKDPKRMITQHLIVRHPGVVGQVMVKLEFWRVDPLYLSQYPTELRTPLQQRMRSSGSPADFVLGMRHPVPSAIRSCAFADKLVAFSTRPHLKWRDLYDLWWLGKQNPQALVTSEITRQYLHNLQAYTTVENLPPDQAILHLMRRYTNEELAALADPDLKNWLPPELWEQLRDNGVQEIVSYVRETLTLYSDEIALQLLQKEGPSSSHTQEGEDSAEDSNPLPSPGTAS
jgi:predicted nucleotidyltransferase component of viral defense system